MQVKAATRDDRLVVRLISADEIPRFNALLDEHHFLGHRLIGRVMRYVATQDEEWVALVGFGSAALSLRPRDSYVGWSEATKLRRLRYVSNNQRFCVLPGNRRPNLASATLARTLRRLSGDVEAAYGHRVALVETFTDPSRHLGTCYKAANFQMVGATSGYGRANGSWIYHGNKKLCWLYPLVNDASALLRADFDHPLLRSKTTRSAQMFDLNSVVIDSDEGLYAQLCALMDHRKPKGVRHELASILLLCVAAMLSGAHNPTEITEWANELPGELRARLYVRKSPSSGELTTPSLSTIQRTLRDVDKEALDEIVCAAVAQQLERTKANKPTKDRAPDDEPTDDRPTDDESAKNEPGELYGIAVDGKSLRGAIQKDGRAIHLLSALTHEERVVIAQREVDHKVNEIKLFRPLLEPLDIKGALVTADAMHTQVDHARFLVEEKEADYFLYVKENQPKLYKAIEGLSDERWSTPYSESNKGHGRIETRTIEVSSALVGRTRFTSLAQVVRITRTVEDAKTKTTRWTEVAYAITSCSAKRADPARLLQASREHWSIENGLHWVRDATMREDASKVRSGSAPRALATMRNLVISVLRLAGATNIAKSLRTIARNPERAFTLLGL